MDVFRQGDVWLYRIEPLELSDTQEFIEIRETNGDTLLALGEVTGHAHRLKGRSVTLREQRLVGDRLPQIRDHQERRAHYAQSPNRRRILRVTGRKPALLTHEEHATIEIPPGDYEVKIQREYTPKAYRLVAD